MSSRGADPGDRRLLDAGVLSGVASAAGQAERYQHGATSHTIHVWWARRPHNAMRALVFAALARGSGPDERALLAELCADPIASGPSLDAARDVIAGQHAATPRLLDMFAGGGTIGLEALRLGVDTWAVDSNELATFINRCHLGWAAGQDRADLAGWLAEAGQAVLADLARKTAPLFPLREEGDADAGASLPVTTYVWTYRARCQACGYAFLLGKRPWLARRSGKRIALVRHQDPAGERASVAVLPAGAGPGPANWLGPRGPARCPRCQTIAGQISAADCDDALVAVVHGQPRKGKHYASPPPGALPEPQAMRALEAEILADLGCALPGSTLPCWSGVVNPPLHGIAHHAAALNPRQRLVVLLLVQSLRETFHALERAHGRERARGVIGLLSGLIDQCVDWNSRLSMWIAENEQVGRAFCGPGVPMLWDHAEIDPVARGPANLWTKLRRIQAGAAAIAGLGKTAHVVRGHAQELPFEDGMFDAVVTDPPYYDNLYYSVLADFFFAWKRILLGDIEPDLFSAPSTDARGELVASRYRDGAAAHETYCASLAAALGEAARTLKPDGVFALIYGHATLPGWSALVRAFLAAPLVVTSVQPLCIERRQRPRAMTARAVHTCLVFVARRADDKRAPGSREALTRELRAAAIDAAFLAELGDAGWSDEDAAFACFARGAGVLCNIAALDAAAVTDALASVEAIVKERFPDFRLARRGTTPA